MAGEPPKARISQLGGELQLPEPIIQRIQYFLDAGEAARTAILSKSWCSAWLTRPNIVLDEKRYNKRNPDTVYFLVFVKKTIQRYEESKLKIDSFCLRICDSPCDANEMIVKALEMGATHLILSSPKDFVLPNEVFEAENLIGLSVQGFRIDLGPDPNVRCSRLQSLTLTIVWVKRIASFISNIIAPCHLLKDLSLSYIYVYEDENNKQGNLEDFGRSLGPIEFPKLHNITCLVLCSVPFDMLFLGDLSSMFPSLKDLTLTYFNIFLEDIRVSSRSLEVLSFTAFRPTMRVEFDVPSIRKFTFEGPIIQSLSFEPTLREWESHLSVICRVLSTSWFLELSKFATQLSQSKLHIYCHVNSDQSFDYEVEKLQSLPKLPVENLNISSLGVPSSNCFALFDGLFQISHPKFITQHLFPTTSIGWEKNNNFLCQMLVQHINEKCSVESLGMHSLHDLKQVNLQVFDEVIAEWQDVPLKSLLDASASPKDKLKIRLGLKWRA